MISGSASALGDFVQMLPEAEQVRGLLTCDEMKVGLDVAVT